MRVYPERMRRNLDLTRGLIFSGQLMLDLAAAACSASRPTASFRVTPCGPGRRSRIFAPHRGDPEIRAALTPEQIAGSFSLDRQLRNVDRIFDRLGIV